MGVTFLEGKRDVAYYYKSAQVRLAADPREVDGDWAPAKEALGWGDGHASLAQVAVGTEVLFVDLEAAGGTENFNEVQDPLKLYKAGEVRVVDPVQKTLFVATKHRDDWDISLIDQADQEEVLVVGWELVVDVALEGSVGQQFALAKDIGAIKRAAEAGTSGGGGRKLRGTSEAPPELARKASTSSTQSLSPAKSSSSDAAGRGRGRGRGGRGARGGRGGRASTVATKAAPAKRPQPASEPPAPVPKGNTSSKKDKTEKEEPPKTRAEEVMMVETASSGAVVEGQATAGLTRGASTAGPGGGGALGDALASVQGTLEGVTAGLESLTMTTGKLGEAVEALSSSQKDDAATMQRSWTTVEEELKELSNQVRSKTSSGATSNRATPSEETRSGPEPSDVVGEFADQMVDPGSAIRKAFTDLLSECVLHTLKSDPNAYSSAGRRTVKAKKDKGGSHVDWKQNYSATDEQELIEGIQQIVDQGHQLPEWVFKSMGQLEYSVKHETEDSRLLLNLAGLEETKQLWQIFMGGDVSEERWEFLSAYFITMEVSAMRLWQWTRHLKQSLHRCWPQKQKRKGVVDDEIIDQQELMAQWLCWGFTRQDELGRMPKNYLMRYKGPYPDVAAALKRMKDECQDMEKVEFWRTALREVEPEFEPKLRMGWLVVWDWLLLLEDLWGSRVYFGDCRWTTERLTETFVRIREIMSSRSKSKMGSEEATVKPAAANDEGGEDGGVGAHPHEGDAPDQALGNVEEAEEGNGTDPEGSEKGSEKGSEEDSEEDSDGGSRDGGGIVRRLTGTRPTKPVKTPPKAPAKPKSVVGPTPKDKAAAKVAALVAAKAAKVAAQPAAQPASPKVAGKGPQARPTPVPTPVKKPPAGPSKSGPSKSASKSGPSKSASKSGPSKANHPSPASAPGPSKSGPSKANQPSPASAPVPSKTPPAKAKKRPADSDTELMPPPLYKTSRPEKINFSQVNFTLPPRGAGYSAPAGHGSPPVNPATPRSIRKPTAGYSTPAAPAPAPAPVVEPVEPVVEPVEQPARQEPDEEEAAPAAVEPRPPADMDDSLASDINITAEEDPEYRLRDSDADSSWVADSRDQEGMEEDMDVEEAAEAAAAAEAAEAAGGQDGGDGDHQEEVEGE